jgi:hypothetical protein
MTKALRLSLFLLLAAAQDPSFAEERIQLDRTTVIDNHELPKVTYIVPWQAAPLPDPEKPPLDILIDNALEPLDRDVLRGRIRYYYETTSAARTAAEPAVKATK